jgi:DNA polymerase III sliding clamp (beta) subunit (PCNA family)
MIRVNRKEFQSVIERCARVAEVKATASNMRHVALSFDGKTLTYMATDMQLALRGTVDAVGDAERFTVNAKELQGILASLEGDEVKLALTDHKLAVSASGRRRFHASTLPFEDYPEIGAPNGTAATLQSAQLKLALTRVMFSAAPESESRQYLQGIKLRAADGKLHAATTDGRRGTRTTVPYDGECDLLLPAAAAREVLPLLDRVETVELSRAKHGNWITAGAESIRHQDYGSTFPPLDMMFSVPAAHSLTLAKSQLRDSLKALSRVNRAGTIRLTVADSTLTLEATGEDRDGIDVLAIEGGAPFTSGFVAQYLIEALTVCETDEVTLAYEGELDPLRLRSDDWEALIMPVRL